MEEIWKTIEDYPDYMISSTGRVKSLKYGKEKILAERKHSNGYLRVSIKRKDFYIHRLVAQAFIPNPDNKPQIDHINTDRTDNRVENIRWVTRNENMNNPLTLIKSSECRKGEKSSNWGKRNELSSSSKPTLQFSKEGELIKKWSSSIEVERELGICASNINACCDRKKRSKTAKGYIWHRYYKGLWLKKHIPLKNKKVA